MSRWWSVVAWSFVVGCVGYALFPRSDLAAFIAILVWSLGVLVWMWFTPRSSAIWTRETTEPRDEDRPLPPPRPLSPHEEYLLRVEWWLNHGCDVPALYGDDGEMACNACGLDFKRMPLDELSQRVGAIRLERGLPVGGASLADVTTRRIG